MKKFLIYFCLLFVSCSTRIPLNSSYFNSESKIGLIVITKPRYSYSKSSYGTGMIGGIIDAATAPKQKYVDVLNTLGPELDPKMKIIGTYTNLFQAKGKEVVLINDSTIKKEDIKLFSSPDSKKKYYKTDLRFLKERLQINEVMIVSVYYGVHSHFSYGIETWRAGRATVISNMVDLNDNSLLYKDVVRSTSRISGEWNAPPAYEKFKNAISKSINAAVATASNLKIKNAGK